ncbi:MAG: thioredoxin domain-containing protein [Anaeromyxobacteraceae bacterium]
MPDDVRAPPGAQPFPPEVAARISAALAALPPGYEPRTRHRDGQTPRFTNRLITETSPYLRQHAHNPVDWHPWGDEAFEEARRTGRPVFLSVGYATCHWCHVMEEESFEDPEIARLLNESFVPVKVDREERPDVDAVYMTAVQALNGHGGWPMSVWLDADRRPFFGGTYFPPRDGDRGAPKGFASLLRDLAEIHRRDPDRVERAARSITDAIQGAMSGGPAGGKLPGTEPLRAAASFYARVFDPQNGGLRGAPKFPSSLPVRLLLRHHRRTGDARSLEMAVLTLERIAAGGIHDQVGGGFHRYSVDEHWLVPHFEKMLYDNALLAVAFAEAWQVTRRPALARVLGTTLDYVLREMTSPEGAFWSATDADSEGEEGRFFVWSEGELRQILKGDAARFAAFYGVTARGNFEGVNVLHVPHPDEAGWHALAPAREILYRERLERPRPLLDDKVLAAWNGLMISALATGGRVLPEPRFVAAAARAADFALSRLRVDGRLQRSFRAGRTSGPGFLEDQAFVAQGLLDLHEATFDPRWLAAALELSAQCEELFADPAGGWFRTGPDHERLVAREKPGHDGAEPSGASVATLNALRLHAFTGDDRWRRVATRALEAHAETLERQPAALHDMLLALDFLTDAAPEVVLVWPAGGAAPAPMIDVLRNAFLPNRALTGAAEGEALDALGRVASIARNRVAQDGRPTAYVCEGGACQLPATDAAGLAAALAPVKPL